MKRTIYCTLGCKLNQFETDQMSSMLSNQGFIAVDTADSKADTVIINTCAVTEKASAKSRQLAARMAKLHPDAEIVITGCSAQMDPTQFEQIANVNRIVGTSARFSTKWWNSNPDEHKIFIDDTDVAQVVNTNVIDQKRSRPRLKIQDGCEQNCTYCIIPELRGSNRSVPLSTVLESTRQLIDANASEMVLTGVRIGSWGSDLPEKLQMIDLLQSLSTLPDIPRIRLGSIEPWELSEELIHLINSDANICNHLHVPLQHTHQGMIQRMGRPPLNSTLKLLADAARENRDLAIGTDIIVGFPGEGEDEFDQLIENVERLPLSYLHVFRYSPRPNTPAASFPDQVSSVIAKERVSQLLDIGKKKKEDFLRSQIGTKQIVIPDKIATDSKWVKAISSNYLRLKILSNLVKSGQTYQVTVRYNSSDGWIGELI